MNSGLENFQKANKENLDKAVESMGAVSKGLQAIAAESADYSKKSFEEGADHIEKLLGVKTLDTAVELQSAFFKRAYESAVGQATKIGELYIDVAKDAIKPFEDFVPSTRK